MNEKRLLLTILCLFMLPACAKPLSDLPNEKPNVLVIVADDLGYSDLGSFGGEIDTPNLDSLANSGLQLTSFYAAPTCSPSRAMLLSGMDNHLVGLGTQKYYWSKEQKGRPGYEGYLNNRFVTLPTRLKEAGYHTYMAGKWHLGYDATTYPSARGFDESYALLEGGASHFDQRGVIPSASKANYRKNGKLVDLPEGFFSSEFFTNTLIDNIESNRKDGKPFFAYAAYTAPHWPLQAPDEFISKYKGKYDAGYEAVAFERLNRMKKLGLLPKSVSQISGSGIYPSWEELTPAQKKQEARLMEIYAGMVDAMDFHIGRLISYLDESGQLNNTIIVFLSDNGAEGSNPLDIEAGKNEPNVTWIPNNFDNSDENLGKANSFVSTGPGWARVSSTPSRLHKGFTSEGGIKVPAFIYYPKMARSKKKSSEFVSVMDIAPTIMELAGLDPKKNTYQKREVLPMTGTSLVSYIQEQQPSVHGEEFTAAWELFGRRAVRWNDWKMIWLNEPWGIGGWQLYNLNSDPYENNDVYSIHPEIVSKLKKVWGNYVEKNEMVVVDKIDIRYSNGTVHYKENETQLKQ
jgi:arylsulfatase